MDVIWWFTAAFGAIAINLFASELFAWGPRLSECLMRLAVRRLVPEIQNRMQEEWAAHLQTIPPGLWRVVAAAGFYVATRHINVAVRAGPVTNTEVVVGSLTTGSPAIELISTTCTSCGESITGESPSGDQTKRSPVRGAARSLATLLRASSSFGDGPSQGFWPFSRGSP